MFMRICDMNVCNRFVYPELVSKNEGQRRKYLSFCEGEMAELRKHENRNIHFDFSIFLFSFS